MNKLFKSENVIVLLVVIALILGIAIYSKNKPDTKAPIVSNNPTPVSNTPQVDEKLTPEEKILFYNPGEGAPKSDFERFFSQVNESAVAGDKIVVNDCVARPLVMKIKEGETFTVDNQGTTDIHFGFQDERTLVKAGTKEKVVAKYKNGHGIYGYGCDNTAITRSIGVLLITP